MFQPKNLLDISSRQRLVRSDKNADHAYISVDLDCDAVDIELLVRSLGLTIEIFGICFMGREWKRGLYLLKTLSPQSGRETLRTLIANVARLCPNASLSIWSRGLDSWVCV